MNVLNSELFFEILNKSGSIDKSRGMECIEFKSSNGILRTFNKSHSYGEYIFDWTWANAYEQHGMNYYPKLTSMIPFTPATASHFLAPESQWQELLLQHDSILPNFSSAHFLFTTKEEQEFLGENGYHLRDSFQYHFFNESYSDFDNFLNSLKSKKAKTIIKERVFENIEIQRLTGSMLTQEHALEMYNFYLLTLREKNAISYLTKDFFTSLFKRMPHNVLYVRAIGNDEVIAGSIFYYDQTNLYGRYWGANKFVQNLHFELCYYQGIEFCIENNIKKFEAGAQGEHKIARGFRPTLTTSAHKINNPDFSKAIFNFIKEESRHVHYTMDELSKRLPFRSS